MLFFLRSQCIYHISQTTQRFIDVFCFLKLLSHNTSFWNLLRSSKINKIQFTLFSWVFLQVFLINMDYKKRMAARWTFVHACKGDLPVLRSTVHGFEHLLRGWNTDFGTVLNKYTLLLILFDLKSSFGC